MRRMIPRPWVILLAAGASRRFGGPKQLARLGGETMLRRMARVAVTGDPAGCIVVLGARAALLRRELRGLALRIVVNPRWRAGMSGSLVAGLRALPADAKAALVLLADQPALGPAELELLAAAWRRDPRRVVATLARARLGPPAVFPRALFPRLKGLRGDRGAREILRDSRLRAVGIELPGAALDVDRPSDLAAFRRSTAPVRSTRSVRSSRARRPNRSGAT